MTRRSPAIVSVMSTEDGNVEVTWEVDSFFGDSEEPEKVLIDLNGAPFQQLDGDETSVEIPIATLTGLGTAVVIISVSFWWSGSPPEEQMSVVQLPVHHPSAGGVYPAARPMVTVEHVRPRTVHAPATIAIAWKSNNYNDGNIFWGPQGAPPFVHSIRPRGEVYNGVFTTDKPLIPSRLYEFKVEVRNTLYSPDWISTTILVRSAAETLSVREFLIASGKAPTTPLAGLVGAARSLRGMLLG